MAGEYPLPARVVALWFVGGMLEFQLYALLVRKLFPLVAPR
jgi:hypothetical protein